VVGHLQYRVLEGHIAEGWVVQVLGPAADGSSRSTIAPTTGATVSACA